MTTKTEYDTLTTDPRPVRPASHYLARWKRRKGLIKGPGGGKAAKFRRIARFQPVTPREIIEGNLPQVYASEYHFIKWHGAHVFCVYCGIPLTRDSVTREHVIPRVKGGSALGRDNLEPCCRPCNFNKGSKNLLFFLASRNRLDSDGDED